MSDFDRPLLQLFERLRAAGMRLTIEQYDLLRQSLGLRYGLDWGALERVCRLLWVKPSVDYDGEVFTREFRRWRSQHQQGFQDVVALTQVVETPVLEVPLGMLPTLPLRRWERQKAEPKPTLVPQSTARSEMREEEGLGAIAEPTGKRRRRDRRFEPEDLPITGEVVKRWWKTLRRPVVDPRRLELDWRGTLAQIERRGVLDELVMRPRVRAQTAVLVLLDEGAGMVPYAPAWRPVVEAIANFGTEARCYRFSCSDGESLYEWENELVAVPVSGVAMELHPERSVVVILSDGETGDREMPRPLETLLTGLGRSAQRILWLNPMPEVLWSGTTAESVSRWLAQSGHGEMVPFEVGRWRGGYGR
jgi:uncharacterized protein